MLEKLVGDNLEIIGEYAFDKSYFLKKVKEIGKVAFRLTSLKIIKN